MDKNINIPKINSKQKQFKGKEEIIARYQYVDEYGEFIFEQQRLINSDYKYKTMTLDYNGDLVLGLRGKEVVPYKLDRILESDETNEVIFIVEGESKADVLNELGFYATTLPYRNTDKWYRKHNKWIEDRDVIIIQDHDQFGKEFAFATQKTIKNIVNSSGILRLKEIYPRIKIGGDIEDLLKIIGEKDLKEVLEQIIENFRSDAKKRLQEENNEL